MKSALLLGDIHFDAEDKKLLKKTFEISKAEKVDHIYFLGDVLDAYALSSHEKHPDIKTTFQYEIDYTKEQFSKIRKMFPKTKITIIFGNHCSRIYKYMQKNCPEIYHFLRIEELLELEKFNIKYVPFGHRQGLQILNTDLYGRHIPYSGGQNHSLGSIKKGLHSLVYAHLHTYQYAVHVAKDGTLLRSFCNMCLVDVNNPKFNYVSMHPNWVQGFSLIHADRNGSWFDEKAMVVDGKLRFRDKSYRL